MVGIDAEWKEPTFRNFVNYTKLPPGKYNLMISGKGSRGNWNREGISIPIKVIQPLWRTLYAIIAYILIIIFSILLMVRRFRRKNLFLSQKAKEQEDRNLELEQRVKDRTIEIEEARREAEGATKAKSIFMANMSHEIRTPLNGISGMLSLLRGTSLNKEQKNYAKNIKTASESLFSIVNDVLDFERIMAGKLVIYPESFSMVESLDFISQLIEPQASDKSLPLIIDISKSVPKFLIGDRLRIIQIITNLITNAIKYSEHGDIMVSVYPVLLNSSRSVEIQIEVKDSGIGIPKEELGSIFEHFTQVDSSYTKQGKGVGLGLAIVKQLCSLMDGTIGVESIEGKGSTFKVCLPLKIGEEKPKSKIKNIQHKKKISDTFRILAAEDEAINRLYIERVLTKEGYHVSIAKDGQEAVEKSTLESFDLILMDLGMPKLGGLAATREIRRIESELSKAPVPIIALTAHAYKTDIDECFEIGMNDYLSKPVNERSLLKKIAEIADKTRVYK
jgi:signal transduction histidine kinase/ActR/RegA family two-component response regulator